MRQYDTEMFSQQEKNVFHISFTLGCFQGQWDTLDWKKDKCMFVFIKKVFNIKSATEAEFFNLQILVGSRH